MIKIKIVDAVSRVFGGPDLTKFSEAVNELGKDRILHVTAHHPPNAGYTRYTILYEDDD